MQAMIINQDYWTRMNRRGTSTILKMANEKKMLHQSQLLNATIRKERVNLDPTVSTEDQDWTTIWEIKNHCLIRPLRTVERKSTLWGKQSAIYFWQSKPVRRKLKNKTGSSIKICQLANKSHRHTEVYVI